MQAVRMKLLQYSMQYTVMQYKLGGCNSCWVVVWIHQSLNSTGAKLKALGFGIQAGGSAV